MQSMTAVLCKITPVLLIFWSCLASAEVVNVEFKFTPFTGNPAKDDKVTSVPGKAAIFINDIPFNDVEVRKNELQVLFKAREISPSVWINVRTLGPTVRKGKNTIRIEFTPADAKAPYRARLGWASVVDRAKAESAPGRAEATNQSDEGVDEKPGTGKIVFQREFTADFAADRPWHHYPAVTALSADDKQRLGTLVRKRVEAFKPDFAEAYKLLEGRENMDLAEIRKAGCLDKAYAAGVRISASSVDNLEFVTTGKPEVVVRAKDGLYSLDSKPLARIKDDEIRMCASIVLYTAYPPRLIVVRTPAGAWDVVN